MKAADRLLRWLAVVLLALITPIAAWAQDDPPGRVGRIVDLQGRVSLYDAEQGQWAGAPRNRPLTSGDRLATESDSRVELRIGSSTLRLAANTEIEVLRLDDDKVSVQLHSGSLALRARAREVADETEIVTAETRLRPQRSGHYRVDRIDDTTYATSWRGELRVDDGADPFTIDGSRRAEIWVEGRREGSRGSLRHRWSSNVNDAFSDWVARDEQRDERTASNRYVSPEMTGAEDLDRNGRWEQHPEFGPVWIPMAVQADWAPYRYGHWAWVAPWGWTWIDDAPWGFAPFHYGRWVSWGGRWCWTPGAYTARPVYAPALVAFVGGPHIGVSVTIGGPSVGWVPLAPREVYRPWYRATPVYEDRVNHRPPGGIRPPLPSGPIMYGNQGVPNAVTVVPRDVLLRREPVARAVIDVREPAQRTPSTPVAAPVGPTMRPLPVDGGRREPPGRFFNPGALAPQRGQPPAQQQPPAAQPAAPQTMPPQQQAPQPQRPPQPLTQPPLAQPQSPAQSQPPQPGQAVQQPPQQQPPHRQPPQAQPPQQAPAAAEPAAPRPPREGAPAARPPQPLPAAAPAVAPAAPPMTRPRPPEREGGRDARDGGREVREGARDVREGGREPKEAAKDNRDERRDPRGNPRERDQIR